MLATKTKTSREWEAVIENLTKKSHGYETETADLAAERDDLALDAELGTDGAQRRLQKITGEIAAKQTSMQSVRTAVSQAQRHAEEARAAEAEEEERQRQAKLSTLATKVVEHASDYTRALEEAVVAGNLVRATLRQMISYSVGAEHHALDMLLSKGNFMRAAEHAGLLEFVEAQRYSGDRSHVVPLDSALQIHLEHWLRKEA
jgi:uncharacterized protein YoxC